MKRIIKIETILKYEDIDPGFSSGHIAELLRSVFDDLGYRAKVSIKDVEA